MDLIRTLQNLGLNEKEAKVYLALLQTGKATAYSVTKYCGLKKPTTYVILEDLIKKGVVRKVPREKVMHYVAISPEDLYATVKGRLENVAKELPKLKALSQGRLKRVNVSYYEGLDGIKEMYKKLYSCMEDKSYVVFAGHGKGTPPELMKHFDEVNEMHKRLDIRRRCITVKHPTLKKYLTKEYQKKYKAKLKVLPEEKYSSHISIEIYKNIVQITSHLYLQGILIDNPEIAQSMKQIFELVWTREDCREAGK